ncbi:MAG: DEAD/DEAH box helicase [Actinomycetaceae bacterium]|nr:DEAD/DEAH box helicase [Actinomycetaceae bacterium]
MNRRSSPQQASTFAAEQLSPAYPRRAAWGTAGRLRAWQAAALKQYMDAAPQDFLAVATPGAGKTTFALRVATELLGQGIIQKVTVVCPTEHLKSQWADAAARVGVHIDPSFQNSQGQAGSHFDGVAVTYAQVAANPKVHENRTRAYSTLVILDEIHHAGDALSWGDGIRQAFSPATRRLALTGTPFRSDTSPIPFVRYIEDESGVRHSRADYSYGYGPALADGVVRPVIFHSYSGAMQWRTSAGDEIAARLGEDLTKDLTKQAWRTALSPEGEWVPAVLAAANQRLDQMRKQIPDAGGLVIASDQQTARAYAGHLARITGKSATVVLSDDEDASDRIDTFASGTDKWMVAVRMVSEGVDVPRLCVGVYATSASTPLYFAQAIGRFVRARRRGETASIFLPAVAPLLQLAANLEEERDHALGRPRDQEMTAEERALAMARRSEKASGELQGSFEALRSGAEFAGVLFDGADFGTLAEVGSIEEQEFLGIPGLLEPEQVSLLLHERQTKQMAEQRRARAAAGLRANNAGISDHRQRAQARKDLNKLVAQWSRRSGESHASIHATLRRLCGGPEVAKATTAQIQTRIAKLQDWFVGKR